MEFGQLTIVQLIPAVSVMIAAIIATVQLRANERHARESHTLNILGELSGHRPFADAHFLVQDLYAAGHDAREPSEEEIRAILRLISHYEHIATAYFAKTIDRRTVLRQRGRSLELTYSVAKDWIEERRRAIQAPGLYVQFERLATIEVPRHVRRYGQRNI
ncbi:MAG: hypothetical protein AAFX52_10395 [Pseudomonadota bacterium]